MNRTLLKKRRTESAVAPAKLIVFGEHFVVYGCPAVAVPVPGLELKATLRMESGDAETAGSGVKADNRDSLFSFSAGAGEIRPRTHLQACLEFSSEEFGLDSKMLSVETASSIPVGSGLGSSAAVSVAVAKATAKLAGMADSPEFMSLVRKVSIKAETLAHGRPSGIDTEVCLTGRALRFIMGESPEPVAGAGKRSIGLVLMSTGESSSTALMVAKAGEFIRSNPGLFEKLRSEYMVSFKAVLAAMEEGDCKLLGKLADAQHERLRILGVSSPELDRLVNAARAEGAMGAKLSGAGGGGVAFAVCEGGDEEQIAEKLRGKGINVVKAARI